MIKRLIFLALYLLITTKILGQQTTLITKNKDAYFEEYSVLANDKKVKHGSYLKLVKPFWNGPLWNGYAIESVGSYDNGKKNGYWEVYFKENNNIKEHGFYKEDLRDSTWLFFYPQGQFNRLVEVKTNEGTSYEIANARPIVCKSGKYSNGTPIGIWEYFNTNASLSQKFDFDTYQLLFLNGIDLKNYETGFIGGDFLLNQHLNDTFDFDALMKTINAKINLKTGKITLRFTIDESGSIKDITEEINTIVNSKFTKRAMQTVQSMNRMWYLKRVDGKPVVTQKTISFELIVNSKTAFKSRVESDKETVTESVSMGFSFRIIAE
jgi:antitoxin component YwqK of YwqJK toxin-antitoxin module